MVKPSEACPAVASLLAEQFAKYMDPSLIRVVNGAIPETTKVGSITGLFPSLTSLSVSSSTFLGVTVRFTTVFVDFCLMCSVLSPLHRSVQTFVHHHYATESPCVGSGRVGRIVATAAAKHLTPVSLEVSQCTYLYSVTD